MESLKESRAIESLKVKELREIAKNYGLKNCHSNNKHDLIAFINAEMKIMRAPKESRAIESLNVKELRKIAKEYGLKTVTQIISRI